MVGSCGWMLFKLRRVGYTATYHVVNVGEAKRDICWGPGLDFDMDFFSSSCSFWMKLSNASWIIHILGVWRMHWAKLLWIKVLNFLIANVSATILQRKISRGVNHRMLLLMIHNINIGFQRALGKLSFWLKDWELFFRILEVKGF